MRRLTQNILQMMYVLKIHSIPQQKAVTTVSPVFSPKIVSSGNRTRVPSLASLNYTTKPTRQSYVVRTCRKIENYCKLFDTIFSKFVTTPPLYGRGRRPAPRRAGGPGLGRIYTEFFNFFSKSARKDNIFFFLEPKDSYSKTFSLLVI